jgi:hypothetical protein
MRALTLVLLATAMSACTSARLDRVGTVPVVAQATLVAPSVEKVSPVASPTAEPSSMAPLPILGGKGYTRFSFGSFMPAGDLDDLGFDDGFYGDVAFGSELLPFLAVEASLGYLFADGSGDSEISGIPLLVQGRLQLPILILEAYAGVGVGGLYTDYQIGIVDDSEFVLAGTAFVGLEVGLGNLALGLEYRYLTSEETDRDFTLEGNSGLLTLTLPF